MDKIYENKEQFIEQYRQHVRALSGKEFEDTSDIDRFTALANMVAGDARVIAAKTDERNRTEGRSVSTTSPSSSSSVACSITTC
ncbi:MAG: hypothetical protein ACLTKG_01515 [Collinsella intestinalis]